MSTRLTGDVSITCLEVKIQLAAESARFVLTLNADPGNVWRYNLSEASHNARNSRVVNIQVMHGECRNLAQRSHYVTVTLEDAPAGNK